MHSQISRRTFLHTTMGATAAGLIGGSAHSTTAQELDAPGMAATGPLHLSFGMIGIGMQGSVLLRESVAIPGVQCVAACDLYDERQVLAKEIAGSDVRVTRRYQELLDNKDIQCLVVAVPDHWHRQIVIDAVSAGKDVYCEKPMSHSIADGAAMVKAVQASGRIVQVGSQTVSSAVYRKAKEIIASGGIGNVSLVELTMGRNDPTGAWVYPVPAGISEQNVDWTTWLGETPRRPFDPVVFTRWRSWRAYGSGMAGDLMVHLISGMQCALGRSSIPDRALASGGIVRWKDGREVPDLQLVLLEYGDFLVTARMTLDTETPTMARFMGSRGFVEVAGSRVTWSPQRGIDMKPSYYDSGFPHAMRDAYEKEWHAENDARLRELPPLEDVQTFTSVNENGTRLHLQNFFTAVQNHTPVEEDAVFGHHAAAACHMANQAYFSRQVVTKESAI